MVNRLIHVDPGRFESGALRWLEAEARALVSVLAAEGLGEEVQRLIAGNYMFGLCARLDGAEGECAVTLLLKSDGELIAGDNSVSLHDFAFGTVDEILGL